MNRNGVHPILIVSAALLAGLTYAVLAWNRTHDSTGTSPQDTDVRLARVLWSSTLVTYLVVVPVILASVRRALASVSWPYLEVSFLGAGVLIFGLFVDFLPRWPELFNSDLELLFICYFCASVGYVSGVGRLLSTWRARSWAKCAASALMVACCGVGVAAGSWVVLYFE